MESRDRILAILGCSMAIFWGGAMAFGYPGVMSTCWQQMYQVGAAQTGAVVTFMLLALAVFMFFSGKIHLALGIRKCIGLGTLFYLISMLILSKANSIYMVYVWAFCANIGCSFIYGPGLTTAQQWMPERRGLASGILNLVFGISAAVMSPIWSHLLDAVGYEQVNRILIVALVLTNVVACILVRDPVVQTKPSARNADGSDLTVRQALGTADFWIIWLMWAFMGAAGISMVSLSRNYAAYVGIASVSILTAFNLTNGIIRIFAGLLSDTIGGEKIGFLTFVLAAIGYLLMPRSDSILVLAVGAACVGAGFGTLFTVSGPIISKRFGLKYFGLIFGLVFTGYGLVGGIAGPALAGALLAHTGNYSIVFGYLAAFSLLSAGLIFLLARRKNN